MQNIIKQFLTWLTKMLLVHTRPVQMRPHREHLYSPSEKKRIAQGVKQFLEQNYELRYNTIKQTEEFRPRLKSDAQNFQYEAQNKNSERRNFHSEPLIGNNCGWRQLTDRELRRIAFEQMEQIGVAWSIDVELYVHSALVRNYNPIADYLSSCPPWDRAVDRIRQLACRVPTSNPAWPDYFHRWFLAMVAQWQQRSRDYGNAIVPILIGGQGTHKSTFCKLLLPPQLREYYIDDIKLDSPEQVERMLSRMLLVNIDEYNAKTEREQAKIKRVLTERDVQTRKMRSDQYIMLPRMASFIATTNDREPLSDSTGWRRYLCCELTGMIDTDTPIDYPQLYAQAVYELDHGAAWYFTKAEEAEIECYNRNYQCTQATEQILTAYYEPAPRRKEHFVRATDILDELGKHIRAADIPSLKALTLALKNARFPHGAIDGYRGWYARRRE